LRSAYTFEAKVFDKVYFTGKMREHRQRRKAQREAVRRLLAVSRSGEYIPEEPVGLGTIPGLVDALDELVANAAPDQMISVLASPPEFDLERYRQHIIAFLNGYEVLFEKIPPLLDDARRDRVFRFVAAVFMDHQGEVELVQYDHALVVEACE